MKMMKRLLKKQKKRDEELKEQLANAFDESSDDEGNQNDEGHSSSASDSDFNHDECSTELTNGVMFHNLSAISEKSPNQSGYHSSEVSKDSGGGGGDSLIPEKIFFSPYSKCSYKQSPINNGSNSDLLAGIGEGDADNYKPIFRNSPHFEKKDNFKPIFPLNEKSDYSNTGSEMFDAYSHAEGGMEQLQVLYEVRLHEIQRLTDQLNSERRDAEARQQELSRKCALLEAEKERALLSRNEANKLLVMHKEEISKLQKELTSLKQTASTLEKEKTTSEELAELSKMQIQDLEQRIALMERCDPNKTAVKQTDILVKELKNKHEQEVHRLQQNITSMTKKLKKQEDINCQLEHKIQEVQRAQESLLVEKSGTINQLARSLEESQAQCHQLMATNVSCENVRLQNQLEDALRDKDQLSQTVRNLQVECSIMKSDLAQYESVSKLTLPLSSSSDDTDSIVQLNLKREHSPFSNICHSRNLNQTDINTKLKDELHRALLNQKAKRAEITRLQEEVNRKENEIVEIKKKERIFLAEFETLKEQLKTLMCELNTLKEKSKGEDKSVKDRTSDKTEELLSLTAELAETKKEKLELQKKLEDLTKRFEEEKRREIVDYNKEYLKFHDETVAKVRKEIEDEADLKVKEYRVRLQQSLQEVSGLKEMYVTVCTVKEQLAQSLSTVKMQLQEMTAERDRLAAEAKDSSALQNQLARKLNESAVTRQRKDESLVQQLEDEKKKLKEDLMKCTEMRDELAKRVDVIKKENEELIAEVKTLRKLVNSSPNSFENQLVEECERLRGELSSMSSRHTQELSAVRTELQGARDRVVQLERSTRLQFETELKSLRQDRDMLKTKCDEKEVQIKKLIESRKRPPPTTTASTQTEETGGEVVGGVEELQRLEERHHRALQRCKEEYTNTLAVMEEAHRQALTTANNKNREDMEQLQHKHQQILDMVKEQLGQQEADHRAELQAVEERTKQLTVKFFVEEVRKLEARYNEATSRADLPVVESLHKTLLEKTKEIEVLKQRLAAVREECRQQVATLQGILEVEKDNMSQLMVQWANELQSAQGEIKIKEAIIDDQREKLQIAKSIAKKYRSRLLKTNQDISKQYLNNCAEYKAQLQENIEKSEKEAMEKIKEIGQYYKKREKELKKKISKINHVT